MAESESSPKFDGKTVHVGMQFGKEFTNEQLAKLFSEVGKVVDANIVRKQNGDPKNFAFVEFETHDDAAKAVVEMNNKLVKTGNTMRRLGVVYSTSEGPKPKKEKPQSEQVAESKTLFVRKLAWKVRNKTLKEHFSKFGEVKSVRVLRRYGFVTFEDIATAKKAKEAMDGQEIEGQEVAVLFSDPTRRKPKAKAEEKKKPDEAGASPEKTGKKSKRRRKKKSGAQQDSKPEDQAKSKGGKKKKGKKEDAPEAGGKKGKKGKAAKRTPEASAQNVDAEQAKKPKARRPRKRLFIKNLPNTLTEKEVTDHFSQYGEIKKCSVVVKEDKETHIGYVQYVEADCAAKAKEAGPASIGGAEIKVYWAKNPIRGKRRNKAKGSQ